MGSSSLIKRFVKGKGSTAAERCLLCAAASIACMFYSFEDFYPHSDLLRLAVFCLMAAAWFCCAAASGKDKKAAFPIFMSVYWILPYVFILYYSKRDNVKHYFKPFSIINRVSKDLIFAPFDEVSKRLEIDNMIIMFIFIFCVAVFYVFGLMLRRRHDKAYIPQRMKTADDTDDHAAQPQDVESYESYDESTDDTYEEDSSESHDIDIDQLIFSLENKDSK